MLSPLHQKHKTLLVVIAIVLLVTGLYLSFAGSAYAPESDSVVSPTEPVSTSSNPAQPVPVNPDPAVSGVANTGFFKGRVVCLPHRNTSGPQTLECAFGLKTENGMYYSLRDTDPTYRNVSNVSMDVDVVVQGGLTKKEDTKYQSSGVIDVIAITPADQPTQVTLTGTFHCLQPTNPNQEHNGDCKYGLKLADGKVYAMDFNLMSQTPPTLPIGEKIRANGVITPIEELSTNMWDMYGITGIFSVTSNVVIIES